MTFLPPSGFYRAKNGISNHLAVSAWSVTRNHAGVSEAACSCPDESLQPEQDPRASLLKPLLSAEFKAKSGASTDGGVPGG